MSETAPAPGEKIEIGGLPVVTLERARPADLDRPSGRTSNADLQEFVAEVALGSFSTPYSFLSYLAPSRWKPGQAPGWVPDRAQEKAAQDREFSYVDMVVDAHRKRSGGGGSRSASVQSAAP